MIIAYHASSNPNISENNISIEYSGKAKNGDQQAAGIHLSTVESVAKDYLTSNGAFITANINLNLADLPDYYHDSDYFPYLNILINIIGEEVIEDIVEDIEENPISYSNINIKEKILQALIFLNDDLLDEIKEHYDINKEQIKQLEHILSFSFQLDESDYSHESCYKMLSATLNSRIDASKMLIQQGIKGFKYRTGDIENYAADEFNFCIFDPKVIKFIKKEKPKQKAIKNI